MNTALVVAGGIGARMGLSIPKQYYKVNGIPIIVYLLKTLEKTSCIDAVYIVCADEWEHYVMDLVEEYSLSKVKGTISAGATRHESMYNGVVALSHVLNGEDYVCILDANRPLVSEDILKNSFTNAEKYGASVACDVCVDSMYSSDGNEKIINQIDRNRLFKGQTPETTKISKAIEVFERGIQEGLINQTIIGLLLRYGESVAVSMGSNCNFKITTSDDINLFKAFLLLEDMNNQSTPGVCEP